MLPPPHILSRWIGRLQYNATNRQGCRADLPDRPDTRRILAVRTHISFCGQVRCGVNGNGAHWGRP